MADATWWADGGVAAYDAATQAMMPEKILLATNAVVDANAVTRIQYTITAPPPYTGRVVNANLQAVARIKVDRNLYDSTKATFGPNANIYGFMYVSPASAHAGTPTAYAIYQNAVSGSGMIFRSFQAATMPAVGSFVNNTFDLLGPYPTQLQPNTKYWVLLHPVVWDPANALNAAFPLSLHGSTPDPLSTLGRAISVWTNRTPAAPTISSPASNSVVTSGSDVTLTIVPHDADAIFGSGAAAYKDVAGVQVQYAPRATDAVPFPAWTDMSFTDSGGTVRAKGWWIKGASANIANEGAGKLATDLTIPIRCGSDTAPSYHGLLPSGTWQVRTRLFDFGHPFPAELNPTNNSSGIYSPDTFPATNTSAWSTPVILTISAQVPAPTPISPIGNTAVPEGTTVSLTWLYRNTANPPFPQATRTVQIRKTGDAAWTDLVTAQASASPTLIVTGFALVSGNQYEWRVKVTDSDGKASTYSDVARFWMVPAPASGGTRPLPSSTIDGATLGCGTHRIEVFRRGGRERVGELKQISYVEWNRTRDHYSDAKIVISGWDLDCGNLLAMLQTWAYEIRVTRDNGYSKDKVWEGPITLLTYEVDTVTIHAKDVMGYAYRRIIKPVMDDSASGDTVVSRATRILQNVFAADDPNILSYLTPLGQTDDPMQYRNTPPYTRTAFEEIDDMAANSGLDYTAVGRTILLWGTKNRIGTLPEFRDKDLGATPIVSEYGMSMANVYSVSDGNGIHGEAYRTDTEGLDPVYGLVEMVSSSWASDSAPDTGTYTQEGINKIIASFEESAERSISTRYPPPVVVRIPDNTTLNADATVSIQQLVPGVVIPLRSTSTLRSVVGNQKLDSVKVIETEGKETITITLSSFSREDTDTDEGEGE